MGIGGGERSSNHVPLTTAFVYGKVCVSASASVCECEKVSGTEFAFESQFATGWASSTQTG